MASKNAPDLIVSGAGWLMQFGCRVAEGLRAAGWDNERIHSLVTQRGEVEMGRGVTAFIKAIAGKLYNPREFFKTRPGLYVSDGFTNLILSATLAETSTPISGRLKHFDLSTGMTDAEIEKELVERFGPKAIFDDADILCATIAELIECQEGGKGGNLLNNGHANLFLFRKGGEVFVVDVRWDSGYREWFVIAGRFLADDRWCRGHRAFSATAELESSAA